MSHPRQSLRILYLNANGISNKIHEIYSFLLRKQVDVACICETFLKPHLTLHAHPEFKIYRLDRVETSKGGLAIIIRRSIQHSILPTTPCKTIENLIIEVSADREKIRFLSCYVPGKSRDPLLQQYYKNDLRHCQTTV